MAIQDYPPPPTRTNGKAKGIPTYPVTLLWHPRIRRDSDPHSMGSWRITRAQNTLLPARGSSPEYVPTVPIDLRGSGRRYLDRSFNRFSPSGGASKDPGRYLGRLLAEEALSEVPRLARRAPRRALASQYARTSLNRASRIAVIAAPRKSTVLNPKLLNLSPGSPCSRPRVAPP